MKRIAMGSALLWLICAGCGAPAEPPKPEKKSSAPSAAAPDTEGSEISSSDKKMLERWAEDAQTAIRKKDWTAAKRAIMDGLRKTEGRPGMEIVNARFVLLRGEAALEQANEPDARRYFTDAMALFHVHKNLAGRFEAFTALGRLEERRGDYAAARRNFDEAAALKDKVSDKQLVGRYLLAEGRLASRQMDGKEAAKFYQEALSLFDNIKDKRSSAEVLLLIAWEDDRSDRQSAARRGLERASVLFGEIDDPDGKVRAVHRLAVIAEREKKNAKAARLYSEAAALYERLGRRADAAAVQRHLSTLSTGDGEKKK